MQMEVTFTKVYLLWNYTCRELYKLCTCFVIYCC